ncbi:MAG: hypothetical protein FGM42_07960 [Ilumatobacteraceae bacterium]|nr:hypothetical protein [Ilumatobacteraceae bacterium]
MPDVSLIQALDLNQAKNGSIVGIVVCVAVILIVLRFISSLVVRLVLSVVFAALGVVIYSQRASLVDCADKVSNAVSADGVAGEVSCTFFGRDVTISLNSPSPAG